MLDYGVDPNLANDDGLTALHQVSVYKVPCTIYRYKYAALIPRKSCLEALELDWVQHLTTNLQTGSVFIFVHYQKIGVCFTIALNHVGT